MKVQFSIEKINYELKPITLQDHWILQTELALNSNPEFFIVSYLSGCPEEVLRQLTLDQWEKIWQATEKFVGSQNEKTGKTTSIVTLNGIEYGMINFDKMTIGEFADLDCLVNSPDLEKKIHEVMAILYRPIIKKTQNGYEVETYNTESLSYRTEAFKQLLVSDVRKALAFFLSFVLQYTKATLSSLVLEDPKTEKMIRELEGIIHNQVKAFEELGMELYTPSPTESFLTLTEQVQEELEKPLTFFLTKNQKTKKERWNFKRLLQNINFN